MNQAKLADLAGISQGKVSTIEAGKANPEVATLNAIIGSATHWRRRAKYS